MEDGGEADARDWLCGRAVGRRLSVPLITALTPQQHDIQRDDVMGAKSGLAITLSSLDWEHCRVIRVGSYSDLVIAGLPMPKMVR